MTWPAACQCTTHPPHPCTDPPNNTDGLCTECRMGCILAGDGSYFVHLSPDHVDPASRLARGREHWTGEVVAYAPAFWAEPAAQ